MSRSTWVWVSIESKQNDLYNKGTLNIQSNRKALESFTRISAVFNALSSIECYFAYFTVAAFKCVTLRTLRQARSERTLAVRE